RAFWGSDLLALGTIGNVSSVDHRQLGGALPTGQWLRLEIPAAAIGMGGQNLTGWNYTLWGGRAYWGVSGRAPAVADPGTFTKLGAGTLTLSPTNAASGSTRVNNVFIADGTIRVDHPTALGTAGTVSIASAGNAATLELGNQVTWGATPVFLFNNKATLRGVGTVRIAEGQTPTWTIANASGVTIEHAAQATGDFFKLNGAFVSQFGAVVDPANVLSFNANSPLGLVPGRIILTNNSAAYEGTSVVTAGMLQVDAAQALGDNNPQP